MKASRPQILQLLNLKQYNCYNYYIQIVINGNNYDDSKTELQDTNPLLTRFMRDSDAWYIFWISCGVTSFRSLLSWVFASSVKE